ncbi:MAG: hypothetical protein EXR57_05765 [Dehalococcoidia bacterium]|nr:hypothetical protein [Dehalococcoidia bacterium]MSQ35305.1 hypothetical protein [Dehalococcoidia bacterium]
MAALDMWRHTLGCIDQSCDTMVALPGVTAGGQVVFAKNSDRPQDECQPLVMRPRAINGSGNTFQCQFVNVPQVGTTWRHVGSRPWWGMGYEHGFNEHQVVIGNEALPSKLRIAKEPKLIGMEILRLALERARSAAEAVDVITGLVKVHGQGKFENAAGVRTYDNIYLCADQRGAYVVECVGHEWAVKRLRARGGGALQSPTAASGFASISNIGMIGPDADVVSDGAKSMATREALYEPGSGKGFSFADAFADRENSESGKARQCRSFALLGKAAGGIDTHTMMATLSDHSDGSNPGEPWVEDVRGPVSLCVHRRTPENPGSTAASLVADLCSDGSRLPVYWCGLYSPCMTLFYPVFIEGDLPQPLSVGGQTQTADSPWWLFYRLTHDGLNAEPERRAEVRAAWRPLQSELMGSAYEMARRGRDMIGGGRKDEAARMLTTYMAENVSRMLDVARGLLRVKTVAR